MHTLLPTGNHTRVATMVGTRYQVPGTSTWYHTGTSSLPGRNIKVMSNIPVVTGMIPALNRAALDAHV